jgi:hypothetical protein
LPGAWSSGQFSALITRTHLGQLAVHSACWLTTDSAICVRTASVFFSSSHEAAAFVRQEGRGCAWAGSSLCRAGGIAGGELFDVIKGSVAALSVLDRDVLSGLKGSSQQPEQGGCDEASKAAFGSSWASAIAVARPTFGGRTR